MTNAKVKNIDEIKAQQPIIIFGKDIREIQCFRMSFICGICCGVAGGLATFLFTSKTALSTNVAFGSLWLGVYAYWIPCRYKYETELLIMEALKKAIREKKKMNDHKSESNKENS